MGRHIIYLTNPKGLSTVIQTLKKRQMRLLIKIADVIVHRMSLQQHYPRDQVIHTLVLWQNLPSALVQIYLSGPWSHCERVLYCAGLW